MKIILVDDERIAIEHITSLLAWDELGYTIAATATNGRSALRLCEELRPQLMIVDIRMPVMDGLELIQAVSEKRLGVKFIVMSAYEDFEYARKAISIGSVSSYLIKHEVDSHKLLHEVNKASVAWTSDEAQRHLLRSEQLKEQLTGVVKPDPASSSVKPPYGIALLYPDLPFTSVPSGDRYAGSAAPLYLTREEELLFEGNGIWQRAGDFPLGTSQSVILFSLKSRSASFTASYLRESFRELMRSFRALAASKSSHSFSICYACETEEKAALTASYRKVNTALLHAVFTGPGALVSADELPVNGHADPAHAAASRMHDIAEGLSQHDAPLIVSAVIRLFEGISAPFWNLRGLFHLVRGLTTLVNERRALRGMLEIDPFDDPNFPPAYSIADIRERFVSLLGELCKDAEDSKRLPGKLQKALRYMHEHYHEDLSIDTVSHATEISASYLHQLFKRELGRTFLDYLTEHRIRQAKRILRRGDAKMTEVATSVGYRSPQHFSQVFKKMTGTLPHQYRSEDCPS
ncbi:helix-turn-helix domain-containing protein [Paenibacillus sp. R14(2021)]|uniref:helix-turn-helix domain-containing protein n=1 Tax=Paenibacillus sp. R14(2021) TaxID=2859228 RepID=UPI001C615DA8|nr:helix-turn-helix domain-containing protein [Paenibacillus sp. R14(2021)]